MAVSESLHHLVLCPCDGLSACGQVGRQAAETLAQVNFGRRHAFLWLAVKACLACPLLGIIGGASLRRRDRALAAKFRSSDGDGP